MWVRRVVFRSGWVSGVFDMVLFLRNMGLKINVGVFLVGKGLKERGK